MLDHVLRRTQATVNADGSLQKLAETWLDGPPATDRLRRPPPPRSGQGPPRPTSAPEACCGFLSGFTRLFTHLFPLHLIPWGCVLGFIQRPEPPPSCSFIESVRPVGRGEHAGLG